MRVTEVSEKDGLMAASLSQILAVAEKLMDALKLAGLPVTGPGLDKRAEASKWLLELCHQMAADLKQSKAAAGQGMRVKQVGTLAPSTPPKPNKKNSKKK